MESLPVMFIFSSTYHSVGWCQFAASPGCSHNLRLCLSRMTDMAGLMERLERAVIRLEQLSAGLDGPPRGCGEVNGVNGGRATT